MFACAEVEARGADEGLALAIAPNAPTGTLAFFHELMPAEHA